MTQEPLLEDLDDTGKANIVYSVDDCRILIHTTVVTHRWFVGELTNYERDEKRVVLLGWYPGESSVGYEKWILQHKIPIVVCTQEPTTPNKRRIRIDED